MKKQLRIDFVTLLAARLHENWRKSFQEENGREAKVWMPIQDKEYIAELNPDNLPPYINIIDGEYCINTNINFVYLSPDWKCENYAIAKDIKQIIDSIEAGNALKDKEIGEILHKVRIERAKQKDPENMDSVLKFAYKELPLPEQIKYVSQFVLGISTYEELTERVIKKAPINPVLDNHFKKYGTASGYRFDKNDLEYVWQVDEFTNSLKQKQKKINKENAFGIALKKSIAELTKKFGISTSDLETHLQNQITAEREQKILRVDDF